jgi:multiple antibiotic resistance protein
MLGPFKVLVPFVTLTSKLDRSAQRRLATLAAVMGAVILGLAGLIGRTVLENFDISVPVLTLTAGLILFLTALQTVLPNGTASSSTLAPETEYRRGTAINPLAFPIIVTPYGLAAVIVFIALSQGNPRTIGAIAGIVIVTLLVDWLAMIYAQAILIRIATFLQIIAIVLSVVQTALGLQIIVRSLELLGILKEAVQ